MARATLIAIAAATAALTFAPPAFAGFVVQLTNIAADNNGLCPGGSNGFRLTFAATITAGEGLSGAFFTIYDVPGTICSVEAAVNWGASSQNTGITPAGQSPFDDPTIRNITFDTNFNVNQPSNGQPLLFDVIMAASTPFGGTFAWQDQTSYPGGTTQSGVGQVVVPGSGSAPEPGTLSLVGLALAALGLRRRSGRRPCGGRALVEKSGAMASTMASSAH